MIFFAGMCLILAEGLAVLWLAGFTGTTPQWMTWLMGIATVWALVMAALTKTGMANTVRVAGAIALALFLLGTWIAGLATNFPNEIPIWSFFFGLAFLAVGISGCFRSSAGQAAPAAHRSR